MSLNLQFWFGLFYLFKVYGKLKAIVWKWYYITGWWWMDELGFSVSFDTISVISEGWTAMCNEALFMFGKNLASCGIRTRSPNCRAYPSVYLIWLRDYGQDTIFLQGQMMHKPRIRELSILLTALCLDKIHIFMKFRHHIPYGSKVVAYKQHFATDNSTVKNQGLSFLFIPHCLDENIFPESFLKIA